jgi:hypothetical protein
VEPYNAAFTTYENLNDVNCSLLFDNKSLYHICGSKLDLPNPTHGNINNIIAQVYLYCYGMIIDHVDLPLNIILRSHRESLHHSGLKVQ